MQDLSRKSFLKFLAGGIAVAAASPALSIVSPEEHIIKDDFHYDFYVQNGLGARLFCDGKKMRGFLIPPLKNRLQNSAQGDREKMFRDLGECRFVLDTYKPCKGEPVSKRIDHTTLTAEWWRTFCSRYGI